MNSTFEDKKRFVLESGLTINELRQILYELEEDKAESQAEDMMISDFVFVQKRLEAAP